MSICALGESVLLRKKHEKFSYLCLFWTKIYKVRNLYIFILDRLEWYKKNHLIYCPFKAGAVTDNRRPDQS
jgi:hypothetical protein